MKRILVLILCLVIAFTLVSCAGLDSIIKKTPFAADTEKTDDTGITFSPDGYDETRLSIFSNTLIYEWLDLAASAASGKASAEIAELKNAVKSNTSREFRDYSYTVGDTLLHLYTSNADGKYGKIQAFEILTPDSDRGIPLFASLLSLHRGTPIEISLEDVAGMLEGEDELKTDTYTSAADRSAGWMYMLSYFNAEYDLDSFYSDRVNTNKADISDFKLRVESLKADAASDKDDAEASSPHVYTGTGSAVIEIDTKDEEYVFHITGNESGGTFSVKAYSADNAYKPLINTNDTYDGVTIDPDFTTKKLEIEATGDWTVELLPLSSCPVIGVGGTLNQSSDAVILVEGDPSSAEISGNRSERYFSVKAYGDDGDYKLLVKAAESYEDTVNISSSPKYLVVTAVGKWRIKLNP